MKKKVIMAEVKQAAEVAKMDLDEFKKAVQSPAGIPMQIDNECRSLRRTISEPSGKGSDMDDRAPVFLQKNENEIVSLCCVTATTTTTRTAGENEFDVNKSDEEKSPTQSSRSRTYSASSQTPMTLNVDCSSTSPSPVSIGSPAPRVIQIRREESVDELTREVAKERDITAAINLSRSWDETSWLTDKSYVLTNETREKRDSIDEVFSAIHPPGISSPVRFIDKLSYSRSLTPSPINVPISPKQRTFRRSLSPSSLRPSLLTSKRKLDPDDPNSLGSPAKRNAFYHSPASTMSSTSTNSSPDQVSEVHMTRLSGDEVSEHAFLSNSVTPVNSPLSCDTRPMNAFAFVKPRYVAPQSPLAAGVNSSSIQHNNDNNRKPSISTCTSYTFTTSVKD